MFGINALARKLFGTHNDRLLRGVQALIKAINQLEAETAQLGDSDFPKKTKALKQRLLQGESMDDVLVEAFALVREAGKRALGLRAYDVQLMGGIFMHRGNIAEMKTGEGKTLVAVFAVYLNALLGRGVHVVTVNDYLATRDAAWMGKVYQFLGMSTGVIVPNMEMHAKMAAYACDVTYTTNNELGFDYLRDNMQSEIKNMVQRDHYFAIIDEVDSILIDEARTPLVISGAVSDRSDLYIVIDKVIPELLPEHYAIDEKARNATLTDAGNDFLEERLREVKILPQNQLLYDPESTSIVHHINNALRAHMIYRRDKDYIVRDKQVILVDEFTGRMMAGRRLGNGLHQAIEAKERVEIKPENVTMASVTFQNYFRLYEKLAGMTGTAQTEAEEFSQIYNLGVVEIPTNVAVLRQDDDDAIYRSFDEKIRAIVAQIARVHVKKQPVLVGTTSIEKSEHLSTILRDTKMLAKIAQNMREVAEKMKPQDADYYIKCAKALELLSQNKGGIAHNVLNARFHQQEAQIIADAGMPSAVTIATNMAGRGTDIQLGGNVDMRIAAAIAAHNHTVNANVNIAQIRANVEKQTASDRQIALDAGGLFVLATERHESRRIDNQLRGRSGRQGDPGRSAFFLSLEDDLMRIFGSDRLDAILARLGLGQGEAITHPWVNKSLEKAQAKVEGHNFDIRKQLLKFDDVMNDQRKVIFEQRLEIMKSDDLSQILKDMRDEVIDNLVDQHIPPNAYADQWTIKELNEKIQQIFALDVPLMDWAAEEGIDDSDIRERLSETMDQAMAKKVADIGVTEIRAAEKYFLLQNIDRKWRDHLLTLEHLRSVVGMRGYAGRDPLNEYKTEAFTLFETMLDGLRHDVSRTLSHIRRPTEAEQQEHLAQALAKAAVIKKVKGGDNKTATMHNQLQGQNQLKARLPSSIQQPNPILKGNQQSMPMPKSRNHPCPCGSGKKYKHCHGKL